jgi:hypothetical protein
MASTAIDISDRDALQDAGIIPRITTIVARGGDAPWQREPVPPADHAPARPADRRR